VGVILGAGLLVLVGVGLFVAGLATGVNALYWACVVVCALAAVLLFLARRQTPRTAAAAAEPDAGRAPAKQAATVAAPEQRAAAGPADAAEPTPDATDVAPEATGDAPVTAGESAGEGADEEDPPVEEVEVTDLLLVVDLTDEVLVVDEHPRYHLAGCRWLAGRETIPLPLDEARTDGFTPCGRCEPDRRLAEQARARKAAKDS
jgi:hypothetical protein